MFATGIPVGEMMIGIFTTLAAALGFKKSPQSLGGK
jgi:hypothetical protein